MGERECRMADAVCKDGKAMRKSRARQERRPVGAVGAGLAVGVCTVGSTARGKQHGPLRPPATTEGRCRAKPPSASRSRVFHFPIPQKRAASPLPFILSPTSLHGTPLAQSLHLSAPAMVSVTPPSPPAIWGCGNEAPPLRLLNR